MKSSSEKSTYPFFETVRSKEGELQLMELHQRRINKTFQFYFPSIEPFRLPEILGECDCELDQITKFRIGYNAQNSLVTSEPYTKQSISRLVIQDVRIAYPFKFSDRRLLDDTRLTCGPLEEPLLVSGGRLRETTYGNVVLFIDGQWYTPLYPMFYGVMRAHLIECGIVRERDLFIDDLRHCSKIRIVNAMMPMEDCIEIVEW